MGRDIPRAIFWERNVSGVGGVSWVTRSQVSTVPFSNSSMASKMMVLLCQTDEYL